MIEGVLIGLLVLWGFAIIGSLVSIKVGLNWIRCKPLVGKSVNQPKGKWLSTGFLCSILDIFSTIGRNDPNLPAILLQSSDGGSLVAVWEIKGAYTRFADKAILNHVTQVLDHLFSNQSEHFTIRLRIDRNVLESVDIGGNPQTEPGIQWLRENRVSYFQMLQVTEIKLTIFISYRMSGLPSVKKQKPVEKTVFEKLKQYLWPSEVIGLDVDNYQEILEAFDKLAQQFESDLGQVCSFRRLTVRESVTCLYRDLNPGLPERSTYKVDGVTSFRVQMAQTPVIEEEGYLKIGSNHVATVLSSVEGCEGTEPFMMREVLGGLSALSGSYTLLLTIHYPDQEKTWRHLEKIQRRASIAVMTSPGQINQRARTQFEEIDQLVYEAEHGAKYLYGSFQVRLMTRYDGTSEGLKPALEYLDLASNQVISVFRKISCGLVREHFDLLPQWWNGIWGVCPSNTRYREFYMLSSHLSHIVLLEGRYLGEGMKPVVVYRSDTNELVRFDPRDPQHLFANGIILGMTGSGKSTLMLQIAMSTMAWYPDIPSVVIDKGGSALPLCRVAGGAFCAIEEGRTINPFDHPALLEGELPPSGHIEAISRFYSFLLGQHRQSDYSFRHTLLLELIRSVLALKVKIRQIPTTRDLLLECIHKMGGSEEREIYREFAIGLREFSHSAELRGADGTFARYLDLPTHPDLATSNRSLVVWELQSLFQLPENLKEAFSFLITYRTLALDTQAIDGKGVAGIKPRNVYIDEVWSILSKNAVLRNFLLELVKTKRKEGMSSWLATQEIQNFFEGHDFRHSESETASLVRNANFKLIGMHEGNLDALADALQLTGVEKVTVGRFHRRQGQYHPFLFKVGGGENVTTYVKVDFSPCEYWTLTTSPHEKPMREELVARYLSEGYSEQMAYIKAITELAKKFPRGVV